MGDSMQAINYYNRAIELDPMNAVFLCNRADAYYNLDNFKVNIFFFCFLFCPYQLLQQEAIEDYRRCLAIDGTYARAYNSCGNAEDAMGKYH